MQRNAFPSNVFIGSHFSSSVIFHWTPFLLKSADLKSWHSYNSIVERIVGFDWLSICLGYGCWGFQSVFGGDLDKEGPSSLGMMLSFPIENGF